MIELAYVSYVVVCASSSYARASAVAAQIVSIGCVIMIIGAPLPGAHPAAALGSFVSSTMWNGTFATRARCAGGRCWRTSSITDVTSVRRNAIVIAPWPSVLPLGAGASVA